MFPSFYSNESSIYIGVSLVDQLVRIHLQCWWTWKWSCSVVSDSFLPHGLQPTRLLHPWDFPGKSTGVGCHFLLQKIFPTQGLNPGLPHCKQMLYRLSDQVSPQCGRPGYIQTWVHIALCRTSRDWLSGFWSNLGLTLVRPMLCLNLFFFLKWIPSKMYYTVWDYMKHNLIPS